MVEETVLKTSVYTKNAPKPIGPYSQAVKLNNMVFVSGQISINPQTNELEISSIDEQARRVFNNLKAICEASGGSLNDVVKLNLYFTDLADFNIVNDIMLEFFANPYPSRAAVQVSALPKNVNFEAEAILVVNS